MGREPHPESTRLVQPSLGFIQPEPSACTEQPPVPPDRLTKLGLYLTELGVPWVDQHVALDTRDKGRDEQDRRTLVRSPSDAVPPGSLSVRSRPVGQ